MRGSSWSVLADLNPILGTFGRSGRPIFGTLGASAGQVWGLAGGFWRPGGENRVMLWKIKKKYGKTQEKRKKFGQILNRFVRRGVQDLGLGSGRGPKWATRVYPRSKVGST